MHRSVARHYSPTRLLLSPPPSRIHFWHWKHRRRRRRRQTIKRHHEWESQWNAWNCDAHIVVKPTLNSRVTFSNSSMSIIAVCIARTDWRLIINIGRRFPCSSHFVRSVRKRNEKTFFECVHWEIKRATWLIARYVYVFLDTPSNERCLSNSLRQNDKWQMGVIW